MKRLVALLIYTVSIEDIESSSLKSFPDMLSALQTLKFTTEP
jgi:hypothetical protein